jgi:hypothetical protein
MQRNARQWWQQNRCSKQLKHGASGDDIGEQTSKRAVSCSVEHSAKTGLMLRRMSADCQIKIGVFM